MHELHNVTLLERSYWALTNARWTHRRPIKSTKSAASSRTALFLVRKCAVSISYCCLACTAKQSLALCYFLFAIRLVFTSKRRSMNISTSAIYESLLFTSNRNHGFMFGKRRSRKLQICSTNTRDIQQMSETQIAGSSREKSRIRACGIFSEIKTRNNILFRLFKTRVSCFVNSQ